VICWAENYRSFADLEYAFETAFLNRCDENDRPTIAEYYQRATGRTLKVGGNGLWQRAK
jgi:cobaltochelatase CobS